MPENEPGSSFYRRLIEDSALEPDVVLIIWLCILISCVTLWFLLLALVRRVQHADQNLILVAARRTELGALLVVAILLFVEGLQIERAVETYFEWGRHDFMTIWYVLWPKLYWVSGAVGVIIVAKLVRFSTPPGATALTIDGTNPPTPAQ